MGPPRRHGALCDRPFRRGAAAGPRADVRTPRLRCGRGRYPRARPLLSADRLLRLGIGRNAGRPAQPRRRLSLLFHRRPSRAGGGGGVQDLCPEPEQMTRYSALTLAREGLSGQSGWRPAWRKASLQKAYDAVVVGGGGHGLATAYYLAKQHGVKRVAVLEKGWIGGGNTGRNSTVIRSNYFFPESVALYDLSLRLYEGLSQELNYNVMLSQRGMLIAAHTPMQMEICARIANAMQLNGVDGHLMGAAEARRRIPLLNTAPDARHQCLGGVWQGRAGVARHDAVAWGYARAASALGVDIVEGVTVTGLLMQGGRITGVETDRGTVRTDRVGLAAAGATPGLVAQTGQRLPIRNYALQAFVSEPVKP